MTAFGHILAVVGALACIGLVVIVALLIREWIGDRPGSRRPLSPMEQAAEQAQQEVRDLDAIYSAPAYKGADRG